MQFFRFRSIDGDSADSMRVEQAFMPAFQTHKLPGFSPLRQELRTPATELL
jgi:hypothetical protein